MSVVGVVSLGNAGLSELRGNHMKYSKFAAQPSASTSPSSPWSSLPSRTGMLVAYTPAFLAALSSLLLLHHGGDGASSSRLFLVESALAVHFFKRVFETLFVHKYSGTMASGTSIPISVSYFSVTALTIYTQILTQEALLLEPAMDLRLYGVVLFLIGIAGNFYHHYLLSKLRSSGDDGKKKEYKIPKGGMFELVLCPHYLFEILGFYDIALISQTLYFFYGSRCMKILYNRYELLWKQVSILRNSVLTWLVSLDPINTLDKIPARNLVPPTSRRPTMTAAGLGFGFRVN